MRVWIAVSEDNHIVHGLKDESGITVEDYCFSNWISAIKKDYDVVHFQYLQGLFQLEGNILYSIISIIKLILSVIVLKLLGTKIVWTGHHTQSHEVNSTRLDWIARQILLIFSNHVIVLEPPIKEQLKDTYHIPCDISVAPLGNYKDLHLERKKKGDPATNFPKEQPFVSIIGLLRKYKRTPLAIRSADQSSKSNGILVAGKPHNSTINQEIIGAISNTSIDVSTHFGFISDEGLVNYVEKSNAILILNDQDTLPATALLAAGCRTPIVTTPGGVKEYLVDRYGIGIVAESAREEDIAYAIDRVLDKDVAPDWDNFNQDHNWNDYVEKHLEIYSDLYTFS